MVDIKEIVEIAKNAGKIIMSYYKKEINVEIKSDQSPVTNADIEANNFIVAKLKQLTPDIDIIAEESNNNVYKGNAFWLVDPIDGTRGFISGDNNFTVNIGLVINNKPALGVIYAPVSDLLYYCDVNGQAFKITNTGQQPIKSRKIINNYFELLTSNTDDPGIRRFETMYNVRLKTKLSSSLKLCYLAEGKADAYPRHNLTKEWDIAAGHAILNAAGGKIVDYNNNEITYGKENYDNPAFIAFADKNCNNL